MSWLHVFREAHQVADGLDKYELSMSSQSRVFVVALYFICNVLRADIACIGFPRGF